MKKIYVTIAVLVLILVPALAWFVYQTRNYEVSEFNYSIEVERERPLVWYYLTDAGYRKFWMANLESLTAIGGVPYMKGEETLVTLVVDRVPYEYVETVTAIDPPTYLTMELEAEGFTGMLNYDLRTMEDGGTRVDVTRRVRYRTLMSVLMEPFLEKRQRETLVAGLQKMKRLAESAPVSETGNPEFTN